MNLLSLGDLIDKLVIENIKIFNIRERLHSDGVTEEEKVLLSEKMMMLNNNRGVIATALDDKFENVINGEEENLILQKFKTYKIDREKNK